MSGRICPAEEPVPTSANHVIFHLDGFQLHTVSIHPVIIVHMLLTCFGLCPKENMIGKLIVLVNWNNYNKTPSTRWLEQQTFVSPSFSFRVWKVQGQRAGRFGVW